MRGEAHLRGEFRLGSRSAFPQKTLVIGRASPEESVTDKFKNGAPQPREVRGTQGKDQVKHHCFAATTRGLAPVNTEIPFR
jgi:hypothetical protein